MDLKFFPEAPAERDAVNRVSYFLHMQMKQFTQILLFSSCFSCLTTGPMSRRKGQHLLKIDLLVAKRVGLVVHIHLGITLHNITLHYVRCMQTILLICMLLIIAGKIDWELKWSTVLLISLIKSCVST